MELQDTAASRVSIELPLGLALLFASLLFICVFFCCCLHWKKLKTLFPSSGADTSQAHMQQVDLTSSPQKPAFPVLVIITPFQTNNTRFYLYVYDQFS